MFPHKYALSCLANLMSILNSVCFPYNKRGPLSPMTSLHHSVPCINSISPSPKNIPRIRVLMNVSDAFCINFCTDKEVALIGD